MGIGTKRALVVGINGYSDKSFDTLKYAEDDASDLQKILSDSDVGEFDEVVPLSRGTTKRLLETNLFRILSQTNANDLVFVYFAGHGALDRWGRLCLVTEDTEADCLFWTGVPIENINQMIRDTKCPASVVLMMDCCYSGPPGVSYRGGAGLTTSLEQFSQGDFAKKIVISAASRDERAQETDEHKHGIFTHYVLKGLKEDEEADEDTDGYVSIEELFNYVTRKVKAATHDLQGPYKLGVDKDKQILLAKHVKTLGRLRSGQLQENQYRLTDIFGNNYGVFSFALYQETQEFLNRDISLLSPWEKQKQVVILEYLKKPESKENEVAFVEELRRWKAQEQKKAERLDAHSRAHESDRQSMESIPAKAAPFQPENQGAEAKSIVKSEASNSLELQAEKGRLDLPGREAGREEGQRSTPVRDLVFISYAHEDKVYKDDLMTMLDPLLEDGLKVFTDKDIQPGEEWEAKIKQALSCAKVAVLLVSKQFLASDFIKKTELRSFLKDQKDHGLIILWVLVSESLYEQKLGKIQAVLGPEKMLTKLKKEGQDVLDAALKEISEEIGKHFTFKRATGY